MHLYRDAVTGFGPYVVDDMQARDAEYEILDTTNVQVSKVKRRGRSWLTGMANTGWCT